MKKIIKNCLFIFFIFALLNVQCSALDYKPRSSFSKDCSKEGKGYLVEKVFDGDTISVETNQKIRLLGIDAFEYDQPPYGKIAKDFSTRLVLNKKVCIETDMQERDIYGRTLGYIFLMSVFVNEELVKNGLAIIYDFPPNVKYLSRLKKAQIYARENMLGVWKKQSYIKETPSEWRHKHPFKKK